MSYSTSSLTSLGSSPREWGTRIEEKEEEERVRFIPTRVGNTIDLSTMSSAESVHPHASGEHMKGMEMTVRVSGSSPREWGTPGNNRPGSGGHRFIPTRVGNTVRSRPGRPGGPVHPHASGEHTRQHLHSGTPGGSSPREWGTLARAPPSAPSTRFIPTRVGNTLLLLFPQFQTPVHPHASGEHIDLEKQKRDDCGSSPREWGTPVE